MRIEKEIPANELETIYRIMMRRIAKGYTAEALNYLIGAPYHYVEDVESLQKPFYTNEQLDRITKALEEGNPESFFPLVEDETVLNISVIKECPENKVTHSFSMVDEEGYEEELFKLMEYQFPDQDQIPNSDNTWQLVVDMVDVMIRSGYFAEPRYPYEVFHAINRLLPVAINPYFLHAAMLEYTVEEGGEHLRMIGQKEGAFQYEEC